ncbi:IclR family transcriptional regulator [Bordetella genomosp. 13]|uniref:IclR family transcriptional regulator n=1 Tax=Bordetella genomosp. 13 TaxID=463040 RepID=UPI0021B5E331|nr:IclR family transcriptional regulator [Bordetella genomosp. 13]
MDEKAPGRAETDEKADKGSDSVRAVSRALDIMLAFSRLDAELTASELLQRVGLSRPTLYRLLYTLEAKGFISSSGDPQRFRLGPAVARLSHVWTETLDVSAIAEPIMRELWNETQETVAVFVERSDMRLCLAEMPSPQPLNFKRGVGYQERIAVGATGRAILAFKPDAEANLDAYLRGSGLDRAQFLQGLEETRRNGYAVSRNELISGAVAVAAPFFSGKGVAGSIGVFGPAARLDDAAVKRLGPRVILGAQALSRALGVTVG